jgi:Fe(3+) dicitrate transport protein
MKLKPKLITAAVMSTCMFAPALAQEVSDGDKKRAAALQTVTVVGILPEKLEAVPGSFAVVDLQQLDQRKPFTVKEALREVPGVHIVGEDTFGLGLNIGVRGLDPRRSSRTLLLEDGMPLFLAPYGDPSAHYSTPLERVKRIEVVKGSGQVLYGPQTIGGMINFVTKPVPTDGVAGSIATTVGNNDFKSVHGNVGVGDSRGGIMFDALKKTGDGVRTGHSFDVQEFSVKGQLNLTPRHTLTAKASHYEEDSNVSETGLGALEYREDPYQAPTGHNDKFQYQRKSLQLSHVFKIDDAIKLSTQYYYADSERASFRQIDESGANGGRSSLERCPTGVDNNDLTNANLCGGRWRPRAYDYWGIEPRLDVKHALFGIENDAVIGFRLHKEDIKRQQFRGNTANFQDLGFAMDNSLPRELINIDVTSKAYYAQNTSYVGHWSITPGVRVEQLTINTDVVRADGDAQNNPGSQLRNSITKVLPGFGVAWNGIRDTTIFAGIHKGFAPPRPDRDIDANGADSVIISKTQPEESTNLELGVRSTYVKDTAFEATLFNTKFKQIVINGPGNGTFINGGESEQSGIELAARIKLGKLHQALDQFYASASYTNVFTAQFKRGVPSENIDRGNRLPYAPRNLASLALGYADASGVNARFSVDHVGSQFADGANTRVEVDAGTEGKIAAFTLLNAVLSYRPKNTNVNLFVSAHNLANKEYLVSRVDGMVAGRKRQVSIGMRYDF